MTISVPQINFSTKLIFLNLNCCFFIVFLCRTISEFYVAIVLRSKTDKIKLKTIGTYGLRAYTSHLSWEGIALVWFGQTKIFLTSCVHLAD